jgi:endo-1,4-beta-xylanase
LLAWQFKDSAPAPLPRPAFPSPLESNSLALVSPAQVQTGIPSVYETLAEFFPVGAAIWQGDVTGPHSELLKKHFNSITAENDMKWSSLRPSETVFEFAKADILVAFARANHMRVRGHTLLWHKQNPAWLFKDAAGKDLQPSPETKALLLQRLVRHIRTVVAHFKEDVYGWDVVNEVIDPNEPDGFRRSPWFLLTGTDYIDTAFRVAREVAPNAKLFINEYDTTKPAKRTFLYRLVRDLKARGVPIDGVGHQMHINLAEPSVAEITETAQLFSSLGLENQITELDVSLYANATDRSASVSEARLIEQGYRYRDIFQALRLLKGQISGVTFWGLADDHTWLKRFPIERLNLPLLFDEHLQAKPGYWGVVAPSRLPPYPRNSSLEHFAGPPGNVASALGIL